MSSPARIDELRKKFDENPRRFFAPLANEYRKAGDFEQAVFICQEYLPQQPGHMSGHIVYGQTLFDMGRDEEAKAVFETALTLDPENLIALKHLGDISRHAGDLDGARSWYQRVLEADPRNDEIMQVLESLVGADAGAGGASTVAHSPISFAETAPAEAEPSAASNYGDVTFATNVEVPEESEELVLEQSVDAEMPDAAEAAAFTAAAASTEEPAAPEESETPELLDLADFAIGGFETPRESVPESEPATAAAVVDVESVAAELTDDSTSTEDVRAPEPPVELATDIILGLPDDTPPAPAEAQVTGFEVEATPPRAEDLTRAIDQLEGLETFSMDAPLDEPVDAPVDEPVAAPVEASGLSSDEPEEPATPDTFATETMADLYAQQGHFESAMEIYGQLLERSPEDAELRRRAEDVERQLRSAAEQVAFEAPQEGGVASISADALEADVESTAPVAAGPTIREFFRELLKGLSLDDAVVETPAESSEAFDVGSSVEPEGSLDILFSEIPTDDADQSAAMSLAQAFSAEAEVDESEALRGTPARLATDELSLDHVFRSATPAKGSGAGAFSLDQFFAGDSGNGDPAHGSSENAQQGGATDDIAQFNAWLNGLKKT